MVSEKMTVLVTGASGFLGKNILKAFHTHPDVNVIAACRNKQKLPDFFNGEVREGDLRDPDYLNTMVKGVDVICHAGTWAAMWSHDQLEQKNFYQPTLKFIEAAINAGVKRFMLASTVVIASKKSKATIDDFSETKKTGFWPHLDYLIDIDNHMKANANRGMQMINLRLGHFVGAGNTLKDIWKIFGVRVKTLKIFGVRVKTLCLLNLPLLTDSAFLPPVGRPRDIY